MDEMQMIDFDRFERLRYYFGGLSSKKEAIADSEGNLYMIKYPQNLGAIKGRGSHSTANNSFSEFIGSHLYEYLDIPVHKTFLGTSRNEIVVACRIFTPPDKNFFEFGQTLNSYFPQQPDKALEMKKNSSSDRPLLPGMIAILDEYEDLEPIRKEIKERFWNMFVVDSVIANPDRNNGNWGVFSDKTGKGIELAPVYDNGNSLNAKWRESTFADVLRMDPRERLQELSKTASAYTRIKSDGIPHQINPYAFMRSRASQDCSEAIIRLSPELENAIPKICRLIEGVPCLSPIQKEYYKASITERFQGLIIPIRNLIDREGPVDRKSSKALEDEIVEAGALQKEKIRGRT